MSKIDDSGFIRDRYQDERDALAEKWQEYLPGRRTDAQSTNGRIISIEAELEDLQNAKTQALLDAFNPAAARGNLLSRLAPLMAKRRREAVLSSVTLTITADASGATVPAGFIAAQTSGPAKFATAETVVIAPSGTATVQAFSTAPGAIKALAGTLTKIDTPTFGVLSVTNVSDAETGRERETDGALRFRMLKTSSAPVGTPEGIFTALSEVEGVTYATVLENRKSVVDPIGMPPHSVFPIVDGGADSDIAAALLPSVAAGIDFTESADVPTADWRSVVVKNPANLQDVTIWFARPSGVTDPVLVTIETNSEYPADGADRIKAAIVDYVATWPAGKTLYASRLYTPANTVPGIDINSITIGGTDRLTLSAFERAVIATGDITVNVVP